MAFLQEDLKENQSLEPVLIPWPLALFYLQSQQSHRSAFSFYLHTFSLSCFLSHKYLCDYIEPAWIIQDTLISIFLVTPAKSLLPWKVIYSRVPGFRMSILGTLFYLPQRPTMHYLLLASFPSLSCLGDMVPLSSHGVLS